MDIKILGSGCSSCVKLQQNVTTACEELSINPSISKVTDMKDIMSYGVMSTPALVIDGKVKSMGRILTVEQVKKELG